MNRPGIATYWKRFREQYLTPEVVSVLRKGVMLLVIGIIVYQIVNIGWKDVLSDLPLHPGFYLIIPILFVSLPVAELLIYRQIWKIPRLILFRSFLIKKVFNEEVTGYSGEVYLFTKIHEITGEARKSIAKVIRDINILSAVTSNLIAISLISALIFLNIIPAGALLGSIEFTHVLVGATLIGIAVVLIIRFRKHLFSLPYRTSFRTLGIYLVRFSAHHLLIVLQWSLVMPETPWNIWLIFISLAIALNRIPLLPGKDMLFVWAGIELSKYLDVASAGVAGMLLVSGALMRVLNLVTYLWLKGK